MVGNIQFTSLVIFRDQFNNVVHTFNIGDIVPYTSVNQNGTLYTTQWGQVYSGAVKVV